MTRDVTSFNEFLSTLEYNLNLTDRNAAQVPQVWFEDFYQAYFACHLSGAVYPLNYQEECKLSLRINKDTFTQNRLGHFQFVHYCQMCLISAYF